MCWVAAIFGVDVGLGVDVGTAVLVGMAVFVEVGFGVSVGIGGGANVEQADSISSRANNKVDKVGTVLCFICPPWSVVVPNYGYDISFSLQ
jgi:hypothetical protein